MKGLIVLVGSGEYLPVMDDVDRFLLENCGADGRAPRVVCLPTAAGQEGEGSWGRWMRMGEKHFRRLGADVQSLPIIDRTSAENPQFAEALAAADLIYFSGGNPLYLFETLNGSPAWEAARKAWEGGAVYAGCSAGAMILAQEIPNFRAAALTNVRAFGILPAKMVFPHFDRWKVVRGAMLGPLRRRLKEDEYAIGLDEETALVGRLGASEWNVMGRQTVAVITRAGVQVHQSGEKILL
jgi:cyanophycinase